MSELEGRVNERGRKRESEKERVSELEGRGMNKGGGRKETFS